ncbi:MAG: hypothetical protein RJQ09_01490 [Cyclobacteriaceae bacterium]
MIILQFIFILGLGIAIRYLILITTSKSVQKGSWISAIPITFLLGCLWAFSQFQLKEATHQAANAAAHQFEAQKQKSLAEKMSLKAERAEAHVIEVRRMAEEALAEAQRQRNFVLECQNNR